MRFPIKKTICFSAIFFVIVKIILLLTIFLYPNFYIIDAPEEESRLSLDAQEIVELTNNYREEIGLHPLSLNARLTQAAINKAKDILTNQYFSHTSPEGKKFSDWIKDVNYDYFYVGENLAIDFKDNTKIFNAWLESPTHKKNIIRSQYQEIGVAALQGKYKNHSTIVVVQLFGTRILGVDSIIADEPIGDLADNYFPPESRLNKIFDLKNLENINSWLNYILIIFVGLAVISYKPLCKINQINTKSPIINRYKAKIFRE